MDINLAGNIFRWLLLLTLISYVFPLSLSVSLSLSLSLALSLSFFLSVSLFLSLPTSLFILLPLSFSLPHLLSCLHHSPQLSNTTLPISQLFHSGFIALVWLFNRTDLTPDVNGASILGVAAHMVTPSVARYASLSLGMCTWNVLALRLAIAAGVGFIARVALVRYESTRKVKTK